MSFYEQNIKIYTLKAVIFMGIIIYSGFTNAEEQLVVPTTNIDEAVTSINAAVEALKKLENEGFENITKIFQKLDEASRQQQIPIKDLESDSFKNSLNSIGESLDTLQARIDSDRLAARVTRSTRILPVQVTDVMALERITMGLSELLNRPQMGRNLPSVRSVLEMDNIQRVRQARENLAALVTTINAVLATPRQMVFVHQAIYGREDTVEWLHNKWKQNPQFTRAPSTNNPNWCNATATMTTQCQNQGSCAVPDSSLAICGDDTNPAPFVHPSSKQTIVIYSCLTSLTQDQQMRQRDNATRPASAKFFVDVNSKLHFHFRRSGQQIDCNPRQDM